MGLTNTAEWIAWAGIVIPLAALAWSAVFYTLAKRRAELHQEYQRFFEITDHLGQSGGSIASKMAAAFELRRYPEYRDVILRICEGSKVEGPAADMLSAELRATADFMRQI